jgi:hypothetical protein
MNKAQLVLHSCLSIPIPSLAAYLARKKNGSAAAA